MRIANILKDFLYDQKYFISFYDNKLYIYGYEDIYLLTKTSIYIKFIDFNIKIKGDNLNTKRLTKYELQVEGTINEIITEYK